MTPNNPRFDRRVPDVVRAELKALVDHWMDRCDRAGVAWSAFYTVFKVQQLETPTVSPADLFELTWKRVQGGAP